MWFKQKSKGWDEALGDAALLLLSANNEHTDALKHYPQLSGKVYCGKSAFCTVQFKQNERESVPRRATCRRGSMAVSEVRLTNRIDYCTIHIRSSSSKKLFKTGDKYYRIGQPEEFFLNWRKVMSDYTGTNVGSEA